MDINEFKWPSWIKAGWIAGYTICDIWFWCAFEDEPQWNELKQSWECRGYAMSLIPCLCEFKSPKFDDPRMAKIRNPNHKDAA